MSSDKTTECQKNVLIVYAHQEPKSFNGALFRQAVETFKGQGHTVETSDLYQMNFDPRARRTDITGAPANPDKFDYLRETASAFHAGTLLEDVKLEMEKLKRADLVIFQFPLNWFGFPAIMKGWFDRVLIFDFAFNSSHMYQNGLMKGKRAMLSFTTGAPEMAYQPTGTNGDINVLLWPIQHGILNFVGFDVLAPQIHYSPGYVSQEARVQWLSDYAARLRNVFSEQSIYFVDISNFKSFTMTEEFVEKAQAGSHGPTVGHHSGKPFSPTAMLKPS